MGPGHPHTARHSAEDQPAVIVAAVAVVLVVVVEAAALGFLRLTPLTPFPCCSRITEYRARRERERVLFVCYNGEDGVCVLYDI